ncbi:hypothetical protein DOY81_012218 [Sarcophaga bullata]|nr:hypothetical protein DOY81_012218 [Sarcophaga bullata]
MCLPMPTPIESTTGKVFQPEPPTTPTTPIVLTTTPVIDPFPKERHEGCGWRNEEGVGYKITGDTDNEAQFEEPFVWQENIRPICLPDANTNFDHSRCYATGWGKDKFGREGKYQVILKKIDLPVVPHATCQNYLRQTRLGLYFNLHESFLCAGGEKGKDTCKGDGGSPLVCPIPGVNSRYYQAGIVAWGVGCNEENVPGVYANIPYLRNWISEKLAARGIPFNHFTA